MKSTIDGFDFDVRLAKNDAEIRAAQRLRYTVFYDEMSAVASEEAKQAQMDFDIFDAHADHLLVIDCARNDVVGTYRFMRQEHAHAVNGFYSRNEFDISRLTNGKVNVMELGRSCVKKSYRTRRVMDLLWQGIAEYVFTHNIEVMFGCASMPKMTAAELDCVLSYLYHHHLAPEKVLGVALATMRYNFTLLPREARPSKNTLRLLPPLIKGYLRLGGCVGDGAIFDPQFNTIDVLIVVETKKVTARYLTHYTRKNNQVA